MRQTRLKRKPWKTLPATESWPKPPSKRQTGSGKLSTGEGARGD